MEVTWGHSGNEYFIVYPAFKRLYYDTSGPLYEFPIMVLLTANTTFLILISKGKAGQVLRVSGG